MVKDGELVHDGLKRLIASEVGITAGSNAPGEGEYSPTRPLRSGCARDDRSAGGRPRQGGFGIAAVSDFVIVLARVGRHILVAMAAPLMQQTKERVERVISLIRPAVQADGGDVELVEITAEGVARVRLHGACVGCPSSLITLKSGIERNLRDHVPEIKSVEAID